jgi:hypothetical protein
MAVNFFISSKSPVESKVKDLEQALHTKSQALSRECAETRKLTTENGELQIKIQRMQSLNGNLEKQVGCQLVFFASPFLQIFISSSAFSNSIFFCSDGIVD